MLVDLASFKCPYIRLDCRYATENNFLGRPVYDEARVLLLEVPALSLIHAAEEVSKEGFGLLLFDGYRPHQVTKLFWECTPPEKREFVADPAKGSNHNRGCAIDLTLYSLADDNSDGSAKSVEMPSDYDEMNERAYPDYKGGSEQSRYHRDLLRKVMENHGFTVCENEWWHFDHKEGIDKDHCPVLDVLFSDVPS